MLPDIEEKVPVTEVVPLAGTTVASLLEQVKALFTMTYKVSRLVYARGEPLRVERLVPISVARAAQDQFNTPFQFARQHSRLERQEREEGESSLNAVLRAITRCHVERTPARFLVCRQEARVNQWVFGGKYALATVFGIPVYEDPDAPDGCLLVCGSMSGDLISDMEFSVVCPLKE